MNYELAKQLKDAGFSQIGTLICQHGATIDNSTDDDIFVAFPTLAELIEACLERKTTHALFNFELKWFDEWTAAVGWVGHRRATNGANAEEAVARLWLALNKPQEA